MANEVTLIIPEIEIDPEKKPSWEEMERRLYQNFFILRETLKSGLTTIQVSGTTRLHFTNGILTGLSTAT